MFSNLFDLKPQRSGLQALGFYIAYLLLLMIGCGIVGGVAGVISGGGFEQGLKIGQTIAVFVCLGLSFLILKAKNAFSFGHVLLALSSGILALAGGGLLGLIPVSFLSTRVSASSGN